eukprot:TRINITY_DN14547_c0_g1_i1.p1 TRINITY_DN14547_c0_g1~~TRINITY_DN14547_c0_g1_i1.p1  ORF type:complete len:529 (-),score=94.48 TRINITY_DN14547_c0_g1_i1:36-1622(-)
MKLLYVLLAVVAIFSTFVQADSTIRRTVYRVSHSTESARQRFRSFGFETDHHRTRMETDAFLSNSEKLALEEAGFELNAVASQINRDFVPGAPSYRSNAEVKTLMENLALNYGSFVRLYSIGKSVLGWPLLGLQLTANLNDSASFTVPRPQFKYVGNMHGDEVVGREMLLYLMQALCEGYGVDPNITRLIDTTDIHILPTMNPDGYAAGTRENANGVDLNRNFPDQYQSRENTLSGRQPETIAVMQWTNANHFVLSANLHGGALVANYPYDGDQTDVVEYSASPDDALFRQLALVYSNTHTTMHLSTEFAQGITNGAAWYTLYGGMQDWNYVYASDFEITLELSDIKWPPANTLPVYWTQNQNALLAYMQQVHCGVRGIVSDENGVALSTATVTVGGINHISYTDSFGNFYRPLVPGTYNITVTAPGYNTTVHLVTVTERAICNAASAVVLNTILASTGSAAAARPYLIAAILLSVLSIVAIVIVVLIAARVRVVRERAEVVSNRRKLSDVANAWHDTETRNALSDDE